MYIYTINDDDDGDITQHEGTQKIDYLYSPEMEK